MTIFFDHWNYRSTLQVKTQLNLILWPFTFGIRERLAKQQILLGKGLIQTKRYFMLGGKKFKSADWCSKNEGKLRQMFGLGSFSQM